MAIPFPQWAAWRDERVTASKESRVCVCCGMLLTGFHTASRMTTREDRATGRLSAGRYYDPEVIKVGCVVSYRDEVETIQPSFTINVGGKDMVLGGGVNVDEVKVYRPVCISGPGCVDCQYLYAKAVAAAMADAAAADPVEAVRTAIHPAQYDARGMRLPTAIAAHLPYTTQVTGFKHREVREAWIDISDRIVEEDQ